MKDLRVGPRGTNRADLSQDLTIMLLYSAKNKEANHPEENSMFRPLTNSDSASLKSKGARLDSANEERSQARANGIPRVKAGK